jgi:anti-sigma regulatory factor (Ser/Thr protein kinase)
LTQLPFHGDGEMVELLVSELVTNVVVHAATPCTLEFDVHDDQLVVAVEDDAQDRLPTYGPRPEDSRAGGRGLRILEALAGRWGVRTGADRKSVWFALPTVTTEAGPGRGD